MSDDTKPLPTSFNMASLSFPKPDPITFKPSFVGGFAPTGGSPSFGGPATIGFKNPAGGFFSPGGIGGSGFGANLGTFSAGIKGLETIGGLWAASKQLKAMKAQQRLALQSANANDANQVKSYNTAMYDRGAAIATATRKGDDPASLAAADAAARAYADKNSLVRTTYGKG